MLSNLKRQVADLSSRQEALFDGIDPKRENNLIDFYVRITPRVLNAERCSVFILDPENRKVWLKAGTGVTERGIEVSVEDSIVGDVIASGKPVIVNDLQERSGAHLKTDLRTGFVTREVICVPVRSKDRRKITGAIEVLNKKGEGRFNAEDQAFLEEVGEHLQSIVDSIFLSQEAVRMSKNLVTVAVRATAAGFIAVGASFFLLVVLSIYAGLPLVSQLFG
jgi:GAF domain-containing protein